MTKREKNRMVSRMARAMYAEACLVTSEMAIFFEREKGGRYNGAMREFAGVMLEEFDRGISAQVSKLRKKIKRQKA